MPVRKQSVQYETGVYCWKNRNNGKIYVGGAYSTFAGRKLSHRKLLKRNKHFNRYLQFAWIKHGEQGFEWIILERCPADKVADKETHWIRELKATDPQYGYNLSPTGGSTLGIKLSEEVRQKFSASRMGKKRGPYGKQKSLVKRGRKEGIPLSQETKDKIAAAFEKRREEKEEREANRPIGIAPAWKPK